MKMLPGATRCALAVVLLLLGATSSVPAQAPAPPATARAGARSPLLRDATFRSASLGREVRYRILLPVSYDHSQARYPVLYLLHGLYGSFEDWSTRTKLVAYASRLRLIVVMPDAGDSWYVNWTSEPTQKYSDYIIRDLIPEIDKTYRTNPARKARAIAGLSMGGYGALNFSLQHPELFAFAGSLSGALNAAEDLDARQPQYREGLLKAFGPPGSPTRAGNDVFSLVKKADGASLPYFYIDCGTSDVFLQVNRSFAALLTAQNAAYEYHELPGGHTWTYWDERVRAMLDALVARLGVQREP